jgi:hypothetical protein
LLLTLQNIFRRNETYERELLTRDFRVLIKIVLYNFTGLTHLPPGLSYVRFKLNRGGRKRYGSPYFCVFFRSGKYKMDYGVAEVINRVIKYLIEGLVVAAAAIFIPRRTLPFDEVATLAVLAAVVFAILDAVSPSMGVTSRQGAGLGLGFKIVGFPA